MEETTGFDYSWLYGILGTGGAAAAGYLARIFFDRRKKVAEDKGAELEVDDKALSMYERFASQLNPRIEALQLKQDELVQNVSTLRLENTQLKIENMQLKAENEAIKVENNRLKVENETIKTDIKRMHDEIGEIKKSII